MSLTIALPDHLQKALRSRHPWVYRNHLTPKQIQQLEHSRRGRWIRVVAGKDEAKSGQSSTRNSYAWGLYDDDSAIALRLYAWDSPEPEEEWWQQQVEQAVLARASFHTNETTNAYRLINGENDFLPSLIADRYDRFIVLKSYNEGLEPFLPLISKALVKACPFRIKSILQDVEGELLTHYGELPPPEITIQENGLTMLVNFYEGQKTGLFLDHRENRRYLQGLCQDKRVLNLFAYTGAFSLYALAGGAAKVQSVDIAEAAMNDAYRNVLLNDFAPERHYSLTMDCFDLLQDYHSQGRKFDLIILDPPSLAKAKSNRHSAARAYRKLNRAALACVEAGGLLATASCTAQISPEHFKEILGEAAVEAGKEVQIIHEAGQAADHPVRAGFMEGRYLKFVVARVRTHSQEI